MSYQRCSSQLISWLVLRGLSDGTMLTSHGVFCQVKSARYKAGMFARSSAAWSIKHRLSSVIIVASCHNIATQQTVLFSRLVDCSISSAASGYNYGCKKIAVKKCTKLLQICGKIGKIMVKHGVQCHWLECHCLDAP